MKRYLASIIACCAVLSPLSSADEVRIGDAATFEQPKAWKSVQPKMRMIAAEFQAPQDAAADDAARVTIMQASGSIDDNINRWVGQFENAKREDAKVEEIEIEGASVHVVELTGDFKNSMGPFNPQPAQILKNHAMLAAIVDTQKGGKIFIKMTGPQKTVADQRDAFHEMVKSAKISN